jgi:hypothetical protein
MGGAMTMHISPEIRRDRDASADARRSVRSLRQTFPSWLCWYGTATGSWWGMPPPAYRSRGLIEAATAEDLALRIRKLPAPEPLVAVEADSRRLSGKRHYAAWRSGAG